MKNYKLYGNYELEEQKIEAKEMINSADKKNVGIIKDYDKVNKAYIIELNNNLYIADEELNKVLKIKYKGYGYHGGGRPKKGDDAKRKTISISGTPAEVQQLQELAAKEGKTVSRFIIESLVK